jgi:hypothetical protein
VTTEQIGAPGRAGVDWRRAEFVLTLLGFVGFLTLPIRLTTIYGGLPAHPLFVHVPVVLIPVTVVAAIAFVIKREWLSRYGIALAVVAIVAMSSIFLTMQAGAALRAALHLQGQAASLISQHAHAAHILAYVYVVFTATLIVTFAALRISGGMPTGLGIVDRLLSPKPVVVALRVVLVLLAIGAGYMVFRTGDLGAKAVWQGRLQAAQDTGTGGPGTTQPLVRRMPARRGQVLLGEEVEDPARTERRPLKRYHRAHRSTSTAAASVESVRFAAGVRHPGARSGTGARSGRAGGSTGIGANSAVSEVSALDAGSKPMRHADLVEKLRRWIPGEPVAGEQVVVSHGVGVG